MPRREISEPPVPMGDLYKESLSGAARLRADSIKVHEAATTAWERFTNQLEQKGDLFLPHNNHFQISMPNM
jgi:hypothetical protein